MSETSSDAESSCGWTIISNEGSDIETLGSELTAEAELSEHHPMEEAAQASASTAAEEKVAESLDETVEEQAVAETLCASEGGPNGDGEGKRHVLSSSDHSDIVTLGDLKEDEHVEAEEEVAANEEFYLGTSCSSQYAFTAAEAVFPVQQPAGTNSSSSEDEAGRSSGAVIRRRRLRKNTIISEPEEELLESGQSDDDDEEEVNDQKQQDVEAEVEGLDVRVQHQGGSVLNSCILIALVVAVSMGFGHFCGTVQVLERHKTVDIIRLNELDVVRNLIQQHMREQPFTNQAERSDFHHNYLDEQRFISVLKEVIEQIDKENQELKIKQAHMQAQREELEMLLKQKTEERTHIVSQQQRLTAENQLLKTSLDREEKSLSALQEELRVLHSKFRDREASGVQAHDSLSSEVQRLTEQLEEEKKLMQSVHAEKEELAAEVQRLRKILEMERTASDEVRTELNMLRSYFPRTGKEAGSVVKELQSRLIKVEKRLIYEQQRSDMWERLYVENKDSRAKGDTQPKVERTKEGVSGKVKETFDAVKNSTKEFVHHHKEQIKKAKEAVKENLRKFSDSVKLTFRHFKDSASTFMDKARGFYDKREKHAKEAWRSHKPHHRHQSKSDKSSQSDHNTRKSGSKVHEDKGHDAHKPGFKGCSSVFSCAYQESMSLFNKAMDPIRADEFYQLLKSYVQQEVDHFQHWKELEVFVNNFFHNGVFIHDQMLFTDFLGAVENYLTSMHESEYHVLNADAFRDLEDFVFRHILGDAYRKRFGPNGPFERPDTDWKESRAKHQQRKQHRARSRPHSERKWSQSGKNTDRHMADVKIELGPMPFDPKY